MPARQTGRPQRRADAVSEGEQGELQARRARPSPRRKAPPWPPLSAVHSGKVKAVLAGGLVLGVGAAVTLASWTDQAYVDATFGTSSFNIQVDTQGGGEAWVEADTEAAASDLVFSVGFEALVGTVTGTLLPVLEPLLSQLLTITVNSQETAGPPGAETFTARAVAVELLPVLGPASVTLHLASSTVRVWRP